MLLFSYAQNSTNGGAKMKIISFYQDGRDYMADFEVDGETHTGEVHDILRRCFIIDEETDQRFYLTNEQRMEFLKHTGREEKFIEGRRYFSEDNREFYVLRRFDRTKLIRGEVGLALPANYKIRVDQYGGEWIKAKGHIFEAHRY